MKGLFLSILLALAISVQAGDTITATIISSGGGTPVAGLNVTLTGSLYDPTLNGVTNSNGIVSFNYSKFTQIINTNNYLFVTCSIGTGAVSIPGKAGALVKGADTSLTITSNIGVPTAPVPIRADPTFYWPSFYWHSCPSYCCIQYYTVYCCLLKSITGSSVVSQQTAGADTSLVASLGVLPPNTKYYWIVVGTNEDGAGTASVVDSFLTPPNAPTLSTPANNAVNVSVNPQMTWNAVTGATSYRIQVSLNNAFSTTVINQSVSGITVTLSGLSPNTVYYWYVNASNAGGGYSDWSAIDSFTTMALPGAPVLVAPANNATNVAINAPLVWNKVTGAASYRVQVSKVSNFLSTVRDTTLTDTTVAQAGLSNLTVYYWRVNATNAGGTSVWSNGSFTTIPAVAIHMCAKGTVVHAVTLSTYDLQGRLMEKRSEGFYCVKSLNHVSGVLKQ